MKLAVRIERELLEVVRTLRDQSLNYAVLKGAATAHLDYARPSLRQFSDADLIVAPDSFGASIDALAQVGWKQAYPLPRHHEQFTHAITLRGPAGLEVDLHQKLSHRAIGELIPTSELLRQRSSYEIAGEALFALADVDRLVHASLHVVASRGVYRRLSSNADVLVLAEKLVASGEEVAMRSERWGVAALVEAGIRASYREALLPLPDTWEHAFAARSRRRAWLVERAYLSDSRRPVIEELAYLRHLRGVRRRMDYVTGYFATDGDYARANRRAGFRAQSRYLWSRLRSK